MTSGHQVFAVEQENAGQRLDLFLASRLAPTSRARIQQLISQDKVLVSGQRDKASFKLRGGEQMEILDEVSRPPLRAIAEENPLYSVYEDGGLAATMQPTPMMV